MGFYTRWKIPISSKEKGGSKSHKNITINNVAVFT